MRSSRREKQDARRRQEQEFRNELEAKATRSTMPVYEDLPPLKGTQLVPVIETKPIAKLSPPRSNYQLKIGACGLAIIGLSINGWYAWNRGTNLPDGIIMSSLGVAAETIMFFLPTLVASLWHQRRLVAALFGCLISAFLFAYALTNTLGFASQNLTETTTAKAERITPAISDAQRKLDALSASKKDECVKRGDRCRQLEKEEQAAIESLKVERDKVTANADPQITSAAEMIAWVSFGRFHPSADDIAKFRLLSLTLLPQLGGIVLMIASRR